MSNQGMTKQGKTLSFSDTVSTPIWQGKLTSTFGDQKKKDRFVTSICAAVGNNPDLAKCDHGSILMAGLLGAELNLSPSPQMGHFYMVPYNQKGADKPKANFQLGYKGMIQLAHRSGQYKKMNVVEVKQGELRSYNPFTEEICIVAIEDPYVREATETVGYFAYFELINGFQKTIYWSKEKMDAHRSQFVKSGKFWNTHYDAMAKKTILRQLISRWGIISTEIERAIVSEGTHEEEQDFTPQMVPPLQQLPPQPAQPQIPQGQMAMEEFPPDYYPQQEVVNLGDV
ncbi:MAG: recombinase RecT [Eubacteriales bacterium]